MKSICRLLSLVLLGLLPHLASAALALDTAHVASASRSERHKPVGKRHDSFQRQSAGGEGGERY